MSCYAADSVPAAQVPPKDGLSIQKALEAQPGRMLFLPAGDYEIKVEPPRYKFAATIAGGADAPQGLHFSGNLFDPGTEGVSNLPMAP